MKIVAGLGRLEDLDGYVDSGADELFCGFAPDVWLETYGMRSPVNRREVLLCPVNIGTLEDMRLLARRAEERRVQVAVAFNSTCYAPRQYILLEKMMRQLMDLGLNRFILADPALMLRAARIPGLEMQASGEFGEFNRESMELLDGWGAKRYIFHRKVAIDEMAACIRAVPGQEYEAFVLNERCHYTGAMCHCLHGDETGPLCRVGWTAGGVAARQSFPGYEAVPGDEGALGSSGCGLCALMDLQKAGITHLKVVGRGNHPERMQRDIRAMKRAVMLLKTSPDTYRETMKKALFPEGCSGRCYYPR